MSKTLLLSFFDTRRLISHIAERCLIKITSKVCSKDELVKFTETVRIPLPQILQRVKKYEILNFYQRCKLIFEQGRTVCSWCFCRGRCFTRRVFVCLSVCLSICLSVSLTVCLWATSRKNYLLNLHKNFTTDMSVEKEELIIKFWKSPPVDLNLWIFKRIF